MSITYKELTSIFFIKTGLDPDRVLRKKIRGLPGITFSQLIYALLVGQSIQKASEILGYSINPVKLVIRESLHPIFKERSTDFSPGSLKGTKTWRTELALFLGYKECTQCAMLKSLDTFYIRNYGDYSCLSHICSGCEIAKSKKYKLSIKNQQPVFADVEKIRQIYADCPAGYHVDHIIPLHGATVSGLHIESNLQYLLASENQKKSNFYTIE